MILQAGVAMVSAWLLGVACITALWPSRPLRQGEVLLIGSLGLGVGLGLTSILFFAASLVSDRPERIWMLESFAAAAVAWWTWSRRRRIAAPDRATAAGDRWLALLLGTVLIQAGLACLVVAVRSHGAEPHSSSDGWTIWNMHARIIFRGGVDWPDLLRAPQLRWTHPDYPLLVPMSVARAWAFVGSDAPMVAGLVSTLFGVATVGLLVGAVTRLRNRTVGQVGGLVLLGTPFLVTFSSNQHADIPLGFHILATLVLMASSEEPGAWRLAALSGGTAGLAAWTKNEGLLFAFIVGMVAVAGSLGAGSRRNLGAFLAGLGVALLPVVYFKVMIAPPNDIVASDPSSRLHAVMDWTRHQLILHSLWRDLGRFGEWSTIPFVAMLLPILGPGWKRLNGRESAVAVVLTLVLAGYYIVYLLTHMDLAFHLDSSLVRLLLQLWPGVVFFWCLALSYQPSVLNPAWNSSRRNAMALFVGTNVAIAALLLAVLHRQLPVNQLGAARIEGSMAGVFIGDGWFAPERHGHDRWVWSKGESTLLIDLDGDQPRTVTLQFSIRGLGERTVMAQVGERILWHARIGENADFVEIKGLVVSPGITAIVFKTDAPGVPESDNPHARKLTYALYNPEIR